MATQKKDEDNRYTAVFDGVNQREWYSILDRFADANMYQTWDYDANRCGDKNLSHFVLRKNGHLVAASQVRLARIPFIGKGAAYVRWGPMWRTNTSEADPDIFRRSIHALKNEYVKRRGLILRIYPLLYDTHSIRFQEILHKEGYQPTPDENAQQTMILDISQSLVDIRKNFKQKWRNCLNRSEKNELDFSEGFDDHLFEQFIDLYSALLERKQFKEPNDINEFRAIQQALPEKHKMAIFICSQNGRPTAGGICSAIGDTGVYLFGATNDEGMKNKGSYLIQWKAIQWMKNKGCRYYNLNGVNIKTNPGGYHFKSGVSGKTGIDVHYLGRYDCYSGPLAMSLAKIGDRLFPHIKEIIAKMGK